MKFNFKINYLNKKKIKEKKIKSNIQSGDITSVSNVILDKEQVFLNKYHGICLGKKNKGIMSSLLIRNVIKNSVIEKNYFLYHPFLFSILAIKKKNFKQSKIYFIRNKSRKQSKSRFK